eukprot:TCALIF_08893-PA protein Name:"Protein of unknown function" AED:0.04 eAED:0.12 QI:0/1/0.5/1/0/0.5/2/296/186
MYDTTRYIYFSAMPWSGFFTGCSIIGLLAVFVSVNSESPAQETLDLKDNESNLNPLLVNHVLRVKKPCKSNLDIDMNLDAPKIPRSKRYAYDEGMEESDNLSPWNAVFPRRGSRNDALRHALRIKRVNDMFSKHALRVRKASSRARGYALRVRRGDTIDPSVDDYTDFMEPTFRGQTMTSDLLGSN